MIKVVVRSPECLLPGRTDQDHKGLLTTCGHRLHLQCCKWAGEQPCCPLCKVSGDFLLANTLDPVSTAKTISVIEDLVASGAMGVSNVFEFFSSVLLKTLRNVNLVSTDRLTFNMLPALRMASRMICSSVGFFGSAIFRQ